MAYTIHPIHTKIHRKSVKNLCLYYNFFRFWCVCLCVNAGSKEARAERAKKKQSKRKAHSGRKKITSETHNLHIYFRFWLAPLPPYFSLPMPVPMPSRNKVEIEARTHISVSLHSTHKIIIKIRSLRGKTYIFVVDSHSRVTQHSVWSYCDRPFYAPTLAHIFRNTNKEIIKT